MKSYMLRMDIVNKLLIARGWDKSEIDKFQNEYDREREKIWNEEKKQLTKKI